jgi:hypothetical protein
MITYVVQIGNSDNKLSQADWALFVNALKSLLSNLGVQIHFFGFSSPHAAWQNCCVVFEDPQHRDEPGFEQALREHLADLAHLFEQDSIALTCGQTEFTKAAEVER